MANAAELTEAFFAKIAGWEAMKQARSLVEQGHVHSSNWTPPLLKGLVQEGSISYRAGLVVKDAIEVENLCSCRASRQRGIICAHSVAVGLHFLNPTKKTSTARLAGASSALANPPSSSKAEAEAEPIARAAGKRLRRAEGDVGGEPLELFVVLPPNLRQALGKPKLMVCLEGKWKTGRAPLNALPSEILFQFSDEDRALLDYAELLAEGETPGILALTHEQFASLLPRLVDHPRVSSGRSQPVTITASPRKIPLQASLQASGEIRLSLTQPGPMSALIPGETTWALQQSQFFPVGLPRSYSALLNGPLQLSRTRIPQFLASDWPLLQMSCELNADFTFADFVLESETPRFQLSLTGGLAQLQAQLQCAYGTRVCTMGSRTSDESPWSPDPSSPKRYFARDIAAERDALARLIRAGFNGPDAQGRFQLVGQDSVLNFFAREFPRLQREWKVTLEERLDRSASQNLERIEPRFQVTPSGEQWFDLEISFSSKGGEHFSSADIQRLIRSSQSHTRLKNGRFALIDTGAVEELNEVLVDAAPQQERGVYRLENRQLGFLQSTVEERANWRLHGPGPGSDLATQPFGAIELSVPTLGELEGVLRPYQKQGVAWLHFLRRNQFGGILADEMGLGKTLQALAFLQTIAEEMKPSERKPSLVVCPTSLVFNWLAEAQRFTPRLRTLALHGAERQAGFNQIPQTDLVVTSYALIRRDAELYRNVEFEMVILDEAQHIKNRQTQNARAVKAVRGQYRLVLTGTPLENSVLDLWSIFDFLMPGYLGSAGEFKERYENPIARDKNDPVQTRLARRVRPFILRRVKREVARDLPEKIEQVTLCELTEDQQTVYRQMLEASRREVIEAVHTQGAQKSRMVVLTALLRLRQICCDLRLLKLEGIDPEKSSGKLDLFQELLDEAIDGGHRVLVFSQFTAMLHLIRERLSAASVDFCYLDGATLNRAEVVARFQTHPTIPAFLISLKAGGVGLNLTGADTVVHFDPWWNPAVEDQATDRAHRIGQSRVVTSYKLIARGTIEEKILNLQHRKREAIRSVLSNEESMVGALTSEELQELFS